MKETPKCHKPSLSVVQQLTPLSPGDLNDLCEATDAAIESGGGFGWVRVPTRETLERYWQGVITMPARILYLTKLDDVICGTAHIIQPPPNNEAQRHAVKLSGVFVTPWARGFGLSEMLIETIERDMRAKGYSVINLDVRETMDGAIQLFEKSGYERFGIHPRYAEIDGKPVKGYYYMKNLGGPGIRSV